MHQNVHVVVLCPRCKCMLLLITLFGVLFVLLRPIYCIGRWTLADDRTRECSLLCAYVENAFMTNKIEKYISIKLECVRACVRVCA